jgi:hypothetical protein
MHPGAPAALWIWRNRHGKWRVRATTAGEQREFRGHVMGATSALTQVEPSRNELRDKLVMSQGALDYGFTTVGHIDGFDFRVGDNGCARFVVEKSVPTDTYRVFVGRDSLSLAPGEFVLCP